MKNVICILLATTAICGLLAVTPAKADSEGAGPEAATIVDTIPSASSTAKASSEQTAVDSAVANTASVQGVQRAPRSRTTVHTTSHTVVTQLRLTNNDVTQIQKALAEKGFYKSRVDGQFGPGTQEAMQAYQTSEGLEANGYPTSDTLAKIGVTPENPPVTGNAEPPGKGGVVYTETAQVKDTAWKRVTGIDHVESTSANGSSCLHCTNGPIGNGDTQSMRSNEY